VVINFQTFDDDGSSGDKRGFILGWSSYVKEEYGNYFDLISIHIKLNNPD